MLFHPPACVCVCSQTLASIQRLSTALNILEKYGCNLTNPTRPKYWRTVKLNNPVFRSTVDAIQVSGLCELLEDHQTDSVCSKTRRSWLPSLARGHMTVLSGWFELQSTDWPHHAALIRQSADENHTLSQ